MMKKSAPKKAMKKPMAKKAIVKKKAPAMPAMQAPSMQPSMGGPGAMGGGMMMKKGGKMMKKAKVGAKMTTKYKMGGKLKKAQTGIKKNYQFDPKRFESEKALKPISRIGEDKKYMESPYMEMKRHDKAKALKDTTVPREKKGGKIKKAQNGIKKAMDKPLPSGASFSHKKLRQQSEDAKTKYNASTSPKVEYNTPGSISPLGNIPSRRVSIDTPGLAAGARNFPVKISGEKGDKYYQTSRQQVKKVLSNQKMGGKTKKAQNGYKAPKRLSDLDSMKLYGRNYDQYSSDAVKNLGTPKGEDFIKKANKARANETRLSKKIYGAAPSDRFKKGGKMSKKK